MLSSEFYLIKGNKKDWIYLTWNIVCQSEMHL